MLEASTRFATENGGKYLAQLCKHFAHKIAVEQAEGQGQLRFSCGTGYLEADPDALRIRVEAPDEAQLAETKSVIESHLLRFAFRELGDPLQWHSAG